MAYFILVHGNSSMIRDLPRYHLSVGIGRSGKRSYSDVPVVGHECISPEEWDETIDQLIKSLEGVRQAGHAKFKQADEALERLKHEGIG